MSAQPRVFLPGQTLFQEGEPSHSLFIITNGNISIRRTEKNSYIEIAKIQPNEVIGELSFFDRLPRSATAVALTTVECLEIPFESLEKMYLSVPNYFKTIVAAIAERLRNANEQIRLLEKKLQAKK